VERQGDVVSDRAKESVLPGVRPAASGLEAIKQAVGNAGMARLLASPGGARALQRLTSAQGLARWPWSKEPVLQPDEPVEIKHEVELDPFMFIPKMEAHAERERQGKHPPTPQKFEPGDHVWYYEHPDPDIPRITADLDVPRDLWFPGSTGPTDYQGHGMEIREFVIYENEVKEGRPHMKGKPGTPAWINNNPGNLSGSKADVGQYKGKVNWHYFLIFPTYEAGYDAIPKWLKAYGYYSKGILATMKAYAPAGDGSNDPVRYANGIVSALAGETTPDGAPITLDTTLEQLSDAQMRKVQDAIVLAEGTIRGTPHTRDDENLPWEIRKRL
jgi:hypothetical protein